MKSLFFTALVIVSNYCVGQTAYTDSLTAYITDYVRDHEVVKETDKKFMNFFAVDPAYRIVARFERVDNGKWFNVETSAGSKQVFRTYGKIYFTLQNTSLVLNIYQSQQMMSIEKYKDDLFLPFTDLTTGEETYTAGRYIDLNTNQITGNNIVVDFNKAYNPYCAYVSGRYACPIPPKENNLSVAIKAGEKSFEKAH